MARPVAPTPKTDRKRRLKRWALGSYRLGVILAALACLRALPRDEVSLDPAVVLEMSRVVIPDAVAAGDPADGLFPLLDGDAQIVGWATSTYPHAAKIQGYSGPSESLVVFGTDRKVKAVRFLASSDTDGHVKKVRDDGSFWRQWEGRAEAALGAPGSPVVVSGATLTSEAMARGVAARFGAEGMDEWFPEALKLADVAKQFPGADRISENDVSGIYQVWKKDELLGTVLRSSRMGISARGYNGTSDVIVCLAPDGGKILGIGFLGSRDNEPYVSDVRDEVKFADGFAGKSVARVLAEDTRASPSLFTSGASYTNYAVVESVREMLRRHIAEEEGRGFPWKASLAFAWIGLGVFVGVNKFGNRTAVRFGFAAISVAAGLTLGWMVSQDQLVGWGMNGFGWRGIMPLLALTAAALVIPAFTGKNVYCNRICPHGAAQTLAGSLVRKRFHLPPKLHAALTRLPWLTLLAIWALAFFVSGIPFAYFEPFETWSSGFVAFVPAAILTVGLVAAFFLPQAYCHYGCPTGALLKFLTASPTAWTRRDTLAALLITAALVRVLS
jgi:NosR/NirI family transcriptional regulator, nitrous oxide reductase regulator